MAKSIKYNLSQLMKTAWMLVRKYCISMSEALKTAWLNAKAKARMYKGVCEFFFKKADGTIRQAFGTLNLDLVDPCDHPKGNGNDYAHLTTYYDKEKGAWRSFKIINLMRVV